MDPEVDVHRALDFSEDDQDGGNNGHVVNQADAGVVLHLDLPYVFGF